MTNKVYIVSQYVDLGSHILKVFSDEEKADKFVNDQNDALDTMYYDGYSNEPFGGKKIFVQTYTVED